MIISAHKARKLITDGKAHCVGHTTTAPTWAENAYGTTYAIIDRYDEQRTDHCIDNDETIPVDE